MEQSKQCLKATLSAREKTDQPSFCKCEVKICKKFLGIYMTKHTIFCNLSYI